MSDRPDPIVLVRAIPLQGDHPRPGSFDSMLELAQASGWTERSTTWALALDWRRRQTPGVKGPGSMVLRQMPVMSVALRLVSADRSTIAYSVWLKIGDESWRSEGGAIFSSTDGVRRLRDEALRAYVKGGGLGG